MDHPTPGPIIWLELDDSLIGQDMTVANPLEWTFYPFGGEDYCLCSNYNVDPADNWEYGLACCIHKVEFCRSPPLGMVFFRIQSQI